MRAPSAHDTQACTAVDAADDEGRTALHWACIAGAERCLGRLLRAGADRTRKIQLGDDAIELASRRPGCLALLRGDGSAAPQPQPQHETSPHATTSPRPPPTPRVTAPAAAAARATAARERDESATQKRKREQRKEQRRGSGDEKERPAAGSTPAAAAATAAASPALAPTPSAEEAQQQLEEAAQQQQEEAQQQLEQLLSVDEVEQSGEQAEVPMHQVASLARLAGWSLGPVQARTAPWPSLPLACP